MTTAKRIPSAIDVLLTLIRVTVQRLFRGRAVWVCVGIAFLPVLIAGAVTGQRNIGEILRVVEMFILVLLPPVFVASSIGEEIEDRTTTYLWSRPIPRWTVIVGKLIALAPIATLLVVAGWVAAVQVAGGRPSADSIIAFAAGALAVSVMSAGIATLVPKQGMALAIVYFVIIDLPVGIVPASIQHLSITRQVLRFTNPLVPKYEPALTMALIAGVWLVIGLLRLRRRES